MKISDWKRIAGDWYRLREPKPDDIADQGIVGEVTHIDGAAWSWRVWDGRALLGGRIENGRGASRRCRKAADDLIAKTWPAVRS